MIIFYDLGSIFSIIIIYPRYYYYFYVNMETMRE